MRVGDRHCAAAGEDIAIMAKFSPMSVTLFIRYDVISVLLDLRSHHSRRP
jgi:hypothetical protein